MTKRKTFSQESKLEAIRLMDSGDKKSSDLARELGVPRNRLYKWREQLHRDGQEKAFPGTGKQAGTAGEIARLQTLKGAAH